MRTLNGTEVGVVAGGDWSVTFKSLGVEATVSGEESVQEIAAAAATVVSDAYWGSRDAMADFYEWAAAGWNYSMACSYHYY